MDQGVQGAEGSFKDEGDAEIPGRLDFLQWRQKEAHTTALLYQRHQGAQGNHC